jgi:hypothetical protein
MDPLDFQGFRQRHVDFFAAYVELLLFTSDMRMHVMLLLGLSVMVFRYICFVIKFDYSLGSCFIIS